MSKKPRTNRTITLIIIFLCVALAFAAVWGIVTGISKLMHYGQTATIEESETPISEPEVTVHPYEEEEALLPPNVYNADGFYEENGIRMYHGGDFIGVPGIDVSFNQTAIDWHAVKEAGIEFAMIRVGYRGYTSGELRHDNYFKSHIEGAIDAGLDVGVYFFSQALTPEEAVEEAEFALEQVAPYTLQYPIVFDWEEVPAKARTDEMNMLLLTSCADAFCKTIEDAGFEASIYFNQAYGYGQFNLASLQQYDFWLAEYAAIPSFTHNFQMWQYTNEGTVPGIEGNVDLNIAFRKK